MNDSRALLVEDKGSLALRVWRNHHLRFVIFGCVLASLPTLANMGVFKIGTVTTVAQILVYSVAALGLNLLLGYSGLISLGTAGFMGMGAYLAAYVFGDLNLGFWMAILAAVIAPTFIGILVGFVSLRIAGLYLAIATLCVSEILLKTFEQADFITGGMRGKNISYPSIFGFTFNRTSTYILLVVVLVLVMMLTWNLVNGQMGRAMHAMRGSESAAQAMGVNLLKYRLIVFAIATAYAGLAGAMYVFFIRGTYPTTWALTLSLNILAAIVIGGFRSIYGTVLGTFVVWAMSDLFLKNFTSWLSGVLPFNLGFLSNPSNVAYILTGVLIIVVMLFFPNGLIYIISDIRRLIKKLFSRLRTAKRKGGGANG